MPFNRDVVQLVECVLWAHEVVCSSRTVPTNFATKGGALSSNRGDVKC